MLTWISFQQLTSGVMWFILTQMIVLRPSLELGIYRYVFFQASHGLNTVMLRHDKPPAEVLGGKRGLDPSMAPLSFATVYSPLAILLSCAK